MEYDLSNDIFCNNIIEQIKNKKNKSYECEIRNERNDNKAHLKFINLCIDREESSNFILNESKEYLIKKKIKFNVNSLKIKIINNKPYFIINKYKLIDNNIKNSQLLSDLPSNRYKIITSIDEIKPDYLCTLILKVKEIKDRPQQYKLQLEDIYNNPVIIEQLDLSELENKKSYCFHGFIYNSSTSKIERTEISHIEELSFSMYYIQNREDLLKLKDNSLVNIKGKVQSFNITNKIITIQDENKNIYKVNATYHLIKQISLNTECKLYNFEKKNNNELMFTDYSFIEAEEETFIEFNFPLYDSEDKYYNKIKINDLYYDINNKKIKIKVDDKDKNNLFLQKIILERIEGEKCLDSYEFSLELNKGKIFSFSSSTEKGGFSYDFYIQSLNEAYLPKNLVVKSKGKDIILTPDKNGNQLKERFTIINFPKQDIKTILDLTEDIKDYIKSDKENNFKYFLLIDDNKKKTLKKFIKKEQENKKDPFNIDNNLEKILEKASKQCYINYNENIEDKLYDIDEDSINKISNLMYDISNGFVYFKFENTKRHYKIIKDIVAFSLNYFENELLGKYYSYWKNYEILLDSMLDLEYIDRIKILISFMVKILKYIENERVCYDMFHLVDMDNIRSFKNFPFVKDAFDIFYKIIDDLNEDCPLFQAIHQFNSIMYNDVISGEEQHSGSILNLNDIKLELVKNINRFMFISEKSFNDCNNYANYEKIGLLVTVNIFSFSEDENDILNKANIKKSTSIILFVLFHECLGLQKKNINNEKTLIERKHYKNDFQEYSNQDLDTGNVLEVILGGKIIILKYLMNSMNSEKLLDPKLYTGKDFNELQNIYTLIEKDNIDKKKGINIPKNNSPLNDNTTQTQIGTKLGKPKKHEHLMYPELLQLYAGIDNKEAEQYKDDEDYQRFLKLKKRKNQIHIDYQKLENLKKNRFGKK